MFVRRIKNNNMATIKFVLYKSNKRKDGSYPVCLRVSKKGKLKYIDLKLSSLEGQWNEDTCRFKNDKRVNPNYELYNGLLSHYEDRKNTILRKFLEERVDWTLNQFESEFLHFLFFSFLIV